MWKFLVVIAEVDSDYLFLLGGAAVLYAGAHEAWLLIGVPTLAIVSHHHVRRYVRKKQEKAESE